MTTHTGNVLTRKQLHQRVWSESLSVVAKDLGVSTNALAKICNRLLVPYPSRAYWNKSSAGKRVTRMPLPAAPEQSRDITISNVRSSSRRERTRLDPAARKEQLLSIAADIVRAQGLHAATMKAMAAAAGISETQAYNYFCSRERLLIELALSEGAKIQEARLKEIDRVDGHYAKVMVGTRTYLRQIDQRGGLLQMLLMSPEVRAAIREHQRNQTAIRRTSHARGLVKRFGISEPLAIGCTVVLGRLCLRAGKLIADKKISLQACETLCVSMVLQGSRAITGAANRGSGRT